MDPQVEQGLAVVCDGRGIITQVLRDDAMAAQRLVGVPFAELFVHESRGKAFRLLSALRAEESAVGWELIVSADGGPRLLHFEGARAGDRLVLVGTVAPSGAGPVLEQLAGASPVPLADVRARLSARRGESAHLARLEDERFEGLHALYNELAVLHRELAKKNAELTGEMARRRAAEVSLGESEARFRLALADSPDAVFYLDRELRWTWFANSAESFPGGDLVGASLLERLPERDREGARRACEAVLATGAGARLEVEMAGRPFEVALQARRSADGRIIGLAGYARDIADRLRLEQERQGFIHLVSHDVRAPLTALLYAAMGLERSMAERALETETKQASLIIRSARSIDSLIRDLLESARLSSGKPSLSFARVDLSQLLRDLSGRWGAPEDQLRVALRLPERAPWVWGDSAALERAIVNLVANALKYSSAGSPVRVELSSDDREAVLSVRDQGVGIPADELPRVYERSFRARTRGQREGLGLGLYIVRLIVEAQGGRAWAESKVDVGSTFSLALPLMDAAK